MLFIITRLLCCAILFLAGCIIISKIHVANKKMARILLLILSVVLIVVLSLIPIENALTTFPSVEDSYKYNHMGKAEFVIEGKTTDLVVGKNNKIYSLVIIPKEQDGWKLGMPLETNTVKKVISDSLVIRIYQYSKTNEYYLSVLDMTGNKCKISDNIQSSFLETENNNKLYTYYSYLGDFNEQYILYVNGNAIPIFT